jgi:hypothetical protein
MSQLVRKIRETNILRHKDGFNILLSFLRKEQSKQLDECQCGGTKDLKRKALGLLAPGMRAEPNKTARSHFMSNSKCLVHSGREKL